ncbi:hypothetical protein BGZ73_000160 [Actinomortierella ambigua]|nr:hypothetical protein BGZ73_000160 [Actinomortierella ambigua]
MATRISPSLDGSSFTPSPLPEVGHANQEPPDSILLKVEFRVGEPGTTCRIIKDIKAVYPSPPQVSFQISPNGDTLGILRERIKQLLRAFKPPLSKKRYSWSGDVYIKPFRWSGQRSNELLDDDNLRVKVLTAWRSEASSSTVGNTDPSQRPATVFVYLQGDKVTNASGSGSQRTNNGANASSSTSTGGTLPQYQRATPAAIQRAMEMHRAKNTAGKVSRPISEPLAMATMARGLARQGATAITDDDDVLEIPNNPTFLQAESIDRQHAELRSTGHVNRRNLPEFIELPITLRIPMDVLRRGLGLPDFSLRSAFDERLSGEPDPPPPPQQDMQDIDHIEPDDLYQRRRLSPDVHESFDVPIRRVHLSNTPVLLDEGNDGIEPHTEDEDDDEPLEDRRRRVRPTDVYAVIDEGIDYEDEIQFPGESTRDPFSSEPSLPPVEVLAEDGDTEPEDVRSNFSRMMRKR